MNDTTIEQDIQLKGANVAPRITKAEIDEIMTRVQYVASQPDGTTSTFVHAYLDGKFYLASGHSACVSPENFDSQIGHDIARGKAEAAARDKVWEIEGYALYKRLHYALQ